MYKKDYFKDDEYWKRHIHDELEEDMWIDDYRPSLPQGGLALDLGCGLGQYSRRLMEYGYSVIPVDISELAINEVLRFNANAVCADMRERLPFEDSWFDLVFANLSIHFFSDRETRALISEVERILKPDGVFAGTVNGLQGIKVMKEIADEVEPHYYVSRKDGRHIRLFDRADLERYLSGFDKVEIAEREIVRYGNVKNYLIFIGRV